jgi:hypothetical protein
MADPMVLEERYRHPKPLSPQSVEQPVEQTPTPAPPESIPGRTSINPLSNNQTPTEPQAEKAYTTYGASEQPLGQSVEKSPAEPSQMPPVAPIFETNATSEASQKTDTNSPATPQQPLSENPLHLPAGAAGRGHTKNQIWLAITLLIIIAITALLAIKFLLK